MNKSYLIAAGLTMAIVLWLLSGYFFNGDRAQSVMVVTAKKAEPMQVQIREQEAEPVTREIVVQGQAEPNRIVTLRAETGGQVTAVVAEKGQRVKIGDVLLRLAMNDRSARLRQAEALLRQREREYAALQRLGQTGFQAESQINEALTRLEAARAELERIQLEIQNTAIRAPINAILNERRVEFGDYVSINDPVAILVDDNPLIVSGQVTQQNIDQLTLGRVATVKFITAQVARGQIRYISATADAATRTFRIEVEIANPTGEYSAGLSAEMRIPVETVSAHLLSPAVLSLSARGDLGAKVVNDEDIVEFYPISIVRADAKGIWVSGLPDRIRLITVGQGFVQAGERVTAVLERAQADVAGLAPVETSSNKTSR